VLKDERDGANNPLDSTLKASLYVMPRYEASPYVMPRYEASLYVMLKNEELIRWYKM
jgi:hypothetical protein